MILINYRYCQSANLQPASGGDKWRVGGGGGGVDGLGA